MATRPRNPPGLTKNISKAHRQASGTVRHLTNTPAVLTNARGRSIRVAGAAHQWLSIVIVDHPDVPEGYRPPPGPGNTPAVGLMRRDWEFLFNHLYSTRAVLAHLHRVAGEPLELGGEPRRYHEFALADLEAEPDPSPGTRRVRHRGVHGAGTPEPGGT